MSALAKETLKNLLWSPCSNSKGGDFLEPCVDDASFLEDYSRSSMDSADISYLRRVSRAAAQDGSSVGNDKGTEIPSDEDEEEDDDEEYEEWSVSHNVQSCSSSQEDWSGQVEGLMNFLDRFTLGSGRKPKLAATVPLPTAAATTTAPSTKRPALKDSTNMVLEENDKQQAGHKVSEKGPKNTVEEDAIVHKRSRSRSALRRKDRSLSRAKSRSRNRDDSPVVTSNTIHSHESDSKASKKAAKSIDSPGEAVNNRSPNKRDSPSPPKDDNNTTTINAKSRSLDKSSSLPRDRSGSFYENKKEQPQKGDRINFVDEKIKARVNKQSTTSVLSTIETSIDVGDNDVEAFLSRRDKSQPSDDASIARLRREAEQDREQARQWAQQMRKAVLEWRHHQQPSIEITSSKQEKAYKDAIQTLEKKVSTLQEELHVSLEHYLHVERQLHDIIGRQQDRIQKLEDEIAQKQPELDRSETIRLEDLPNMTPLSLHRRSLSSSPSKSPKSLMPVKDSPKPTRLSDDLYPPMPATEGPHLDTSSRQPTNPNSNRRSRSTTPAGHKLVHYTNGSHKQIHPDGTTVLTFANGDLQTTNARDSTSSYYYAASKVWQTTRADGSVQWEFPHGQVEHHFPDGRKVVCFPDGSISRIRADGTTESTSSPQRRIMQDQQFFR
jgi:hypothetical protein